MFDLLVNTRQDLQVRTLNLLCVSFHLVKAVIFENNELSLSLLQSGSFTSLGLFFAMGDVSEASKI